MAPTGSLRADRGDTLGSGSARRRGADALCSRAVRAGLWNVAFGLVGVVAGATGRFALPGTSTSTPLMVVGGLVAAFGVSQLLRGRR